MPVLLYSTCNTLFLIIVPHTAPPHHYESVFYWVLL